MKCIRTHKDKIILHSVNSVIKALQKFFSWKYVLAGSLAKLFLFFSLILVQEAKTQGNILDSFLFSVQIKQVFSYADTNFFLQLNPISILQNTYLYGTLGNEWTVITRLLTVQKYSSTSFIKSS